MAKLCICVYRGDGGLTDGHAWTEYTNDAGVSHSYGTWGNKNPVGLHKDLEKQFEAQGSYRPKVCCCVTLTAAQEAAYLAYLGAAEAKEWTTLNNCSSFASRAWKAAGLGTLDPNWLGIPNPNSLADEIKKRCAELGGTLGGGSGSGGGTDGSSSSSDSSS